MAMIGGAVRSKVILSQVFRTMGCQSVRQCHWLPDFKPGPYPKTEEERRAAAKKYNLLPEEYEPLPDDGYGCGDYPKLPNESVDVRDPYYVWDLPHLRRNFGDPVNIIEVMLLPEQISTKKQPISKKKACTIYISIFGGLALLVYMFKDFYIPSPLMEKQYLGQGITHYTFELDYDQKKK